MLTASKFNIYILIVLFSFLNTKLANANSTCSRIAKVNYQEILVDTNSRKKGEGLRYYLEKDPESVELLDKYQDGTEVSTASAILGTASTGLIVAGLLTNNDNKTRSGFIISGAALLITNFLFSRTIEANNEQYLYKAIEIYNRRNLPRIQFDTRNSAGVDTDYQFMLNKEWSF